jgi:hypothetical protein
MYCDASLANFMQSSALGDVDTASASSRREYSIIIGCHPIVACSRSNDWIMDVVRSRMASIRSEIGRLFSRRRESQRSREYRNTTAKATHEIEHATERITTIMATPFR